MQLGIYFDPETKKNSDTEMCETCGVITLAPNTITLPSTTEAQAKALGLSIQSIRGIPEQYYNEDTDMCACTSCNGETK